MISLFNFSEIKNLHETGWFNCTMSLVPRYSFLQHVKSFVSVAAISWLCFPIELTAMKERRNE